MWHRKAKTKQSRAKPGPDAFLMHSDGVFLLLSITLLSFIQPEPELKKGGLVKMLKVGVVRM